ncbi:UDP-glucose 4-epimerase GalE [uncultured Brevundimonas sp.]|uniref:UDP-glucose 4-epimerase GalE n=1 Tax=uncultured Brevundimonas sp. TaxID=213418 RepID=UPI0026067CA0|nr:UDP-glucose 4-epimerase GalE [uncultured Brevundimonas sp.]HRJ63004.1 UDP-glucose 4-epimerase GalE [Brevundimonas sp.]
MSSNTVLVTGGAGYIGSHVVLALREAGRPVVVVDNLVTGRREAVPSDVLLHEFDVADRARVARVLADHEISAVMHFAGSIVVSESVEDPVKYYANNTSASLALLSACVAAGVDRFIFSSTAAVYGEPSVAEVDESTPTAPISPYGSSKLMTEWMIQDIERAHPWFRAVRLRYFNVAGADPAGRTGQAGPESTHLIRVALDTALGRREALEIFGDDYDTRDGTCERDYIHVSDLADAHVAALNYLDAGGKGDVFNCGYGRGVTVKEVVAEIGRITGSPLRHRRAPRRAGDPPSLISNPVKLRASLAWEPRNAELARILETALAWQRSRVHPGTSSDQRRGAGDELTRAFDDYVPAKA